jgi:hypothetical protein
MSLTSLDTGYSAITAGTTQTLAGATAFYTDVVGVTTGNASDGIVLPAISPGKVIFVRNLSANAGKMYVANGGTIDGTAGATGVALTASKTTAVTCTGWTTGTVGKAPVLVSFAMA